MSPHRKIDVREEGGALVLSVGGYLDSQLGEDVEKAVRARLDGGGRRIVLNFRGTRLMNSIGISFLIGVVEEVMKREGRVAFCDVSRVNRDMFRVTGVSKHVPFFDTEREALDYLAGNA